MAEIFSFFLSMLSYICPLHLVRDEEPRLPSSEQKISSQSRSEHPLSCLRVSPRVCCVPNVLQHVWLPPVSTTAILTVCPLYTSHSGLFKPPLAFSAACGAGGPAISVSRHLFLFLAHFEPHRGERRIVNPIGGSVEVKGLHVTNFTLTMYQEKHEE